MIGFEASKTNPNKLEFNFKKALENSFNKDETVHADAKFFSKLNDNQKFQDTVMVVKKTNNVVDKIRKIDIISENAETGSEVWGEAKAIMELIGDFKGTTPVKDTAKFIDTTYKTIKALAS